jgi:flagellar motor protein MotB
MAAIRQDDRAYRRGVVFGFTVAEIVLLLVFCLLLLFVPLLLDDSTKAPKSSAGSTTYVELPGPSADRTGGAAERAIGSPEAAQLAKELNAEPDAEKSAAPAMGEPSRADASPATAADAPLPEDWIRVAPNAANSKTSRREGGSQPQREGQPAADVPFEALPLASVCKKLGIPATDCTTSAASEKFSLLGRHNWPPIIKLKEADGEFFVVGSAQVSPAFEAKIRKDVVPKILDLVSRFQTDVVEIVGHTDEQPIPPGIPSTLDALSIDVIAKGESAGRLIAADNAGLGFARALAVVQILRKEDQLKGLTIVPLSAAQMIDVNGKLSNGSKGGDVKERRRIELRVRQNSSAE